MAKRIRAVETPENKQARKEKAEAQKALQEKRRKDTERKQRAVADYQSQVVGIRDLAAMTASVNWSRVYRALQESQREHRDALVTCEGKDVKGHQEAIKAITTLVDEVKRPVDDLTAYINAMPLFAAHMRERAEWNEALGRVEIRMV